MEKYNSKDQTSLHASDVRPAKDSLSIERLTSEVITSLQQTITKTEILASERSRQKQSNSRVVGVSKELKELLKVMSLYLN